MSRTNAFKVGIATPCSKKWDDFKRIDATRSFCQQCEKAVVDFTHMSDQQLLNYLQKAQGSVCGRLKKDQLKHYPILQKRSTFGFKHLRKSMVALALLLMTKPSIGSAQAFAKHPTYLQEKEFQPQVAEATEGVTVSGKVLERYTGEELPGVSVLLKGTMQGVSTNLEGYFSFPEKLQKGDVLVFRFIGMEPKEYKIKDDTLESLSIELELRADIQGEISINHIYTGQPNKIGVWQKVASWF